MANQSVVAMASIHFELPNRDIYATNEIRSVYQHSCSGPMTLGIEAKG